MELLPVVGRELRVQARRGSTYWTRVATSAIALLAMLWVIVAGGGAAGFGNNGKTLFQAISIVSFIYCFFVGGLLTADCISFEKREETLGLLFLTDLKGRDVVLGKVASSSLNAAYGTLGLLPIMSLAILFGGVTPFEVGQMGAILASTLFWSLAAGVFISSISVNERKASFGTLVLILALTLGPFAAWLLLDFMVGFSPANPYFAAVAGFSPLFAFGAVSSSTFGPSNSFRIPISLCEINVLALVLMAGASALTSRVIRHRPVGRTRQNWENGWRIFIFGTLSQRRVLRRRLLDRNPCFWLSSRERLKPLYGWVAIVPLSLIGYFVLTQYPGGALETGLLLGCVLHILFKVWLAGEVCQRWVWDRRSGAFELILSSPLSSREMIRGQNMALRRQFLWPCVGLMLLTLVYWFVSKSHVGAGIRRWFLISIPIFAADCLALRWVAAWRGLTARGVDRALMASLSTLFGVRWALAGLMSGTFALWTWLQMRPLPEYLSGVWPWLGAALMFDFCVGWSAKQKVLQFFEDITASPEKLDSTASPAVNSISGSGESELEAKKMSRRFPRSFHRLWVRWQAYAVIVLLAGAAAYATYLKGLRREVNSQLEKLRKASAAESLLTGEVDPFTRRGPGIALPKGTNQNVADILIAALSANQKINGVELPVYHALLRKMLMGRQNQSVLPGLGTSSCPHPLAPDLHTLLAGIVSSNKTGLDRIYSQPSAALRQGWFSSPTSGKPWLTEIYSLLIAIELLKFDALVRMDSGNLNGALQSLHCLLDLEYSLKHVSTYSYRLQASQNAFTALQWILSSPGSLEPRMPDKVLGQDNNSVMGYAIPTAELEKIEMKLRAESGNDWTASMLNLVAMSQTWYAPSTLSQRMGFGTLPQAEVNRMWIRSRVARFTGESDREYGAFLKAVGRLIDARKIPFPERIYRARSAIEEVRQVQGLISQGDYARPHLAQTLLFYFNNQLELDQRLPAALASVAVEKFRLRHAGELPRSLSELVPDFLPALPIDPFDGKPMRYKIRGSSPVAKGSTGGYCIYSIGSNGIDDQGAELDPWRPYINTGGDDVGISVFH
jgi:ABC-type transport system involved in multi-copper enzyme maturation permease subunit